MPKLRYVDNRKKTYSNMKCFGKGLTLPNKDNVIECSDKEAEALLKMKNGGKPIFEKTGGGKKKEEEEEGTEIRVELNTGGYHSN